MSNLLPAVSVLLSLALTPEVQQGLRLDGKSVIQWRGSALYVEGDQHGSLSTDAGRIFAVWPGPVTGTLAIHSEKGIGLLIGQTVQTLFALAVNGALVRAPRHDVVWIGNTDQLPEGPRARVRELRGSSFGRTVLDVPGDLKDFDVSALGAVAYLLADGTVHAAVGDGTGDIVVPSEKRQVRPLRVFLARDQSELALLFSDALCRVSVTTREWKCEAFDPGRQAVIRQAWDGRLLLEPLLGP